MSTVISTVKNHSAIDSTAWQEMSVNDLIDQKNVLLERYYFMMELDNRAVANQILSGINELEALIQLKA